MLNPGNPLLDDEERSLLDEKPEECLRRAVGRAALSLDEITSDLPAHIAAAIRGIVSGERPASLPPARLEPEHRPGASRRWLGQPQDNQEAASELEWTHRTLGGCYPHIDRLLSEGLLTPDEALEAARAMDAALGRYSTGCRYAAP